MCGRFTLAISKQELRRYLKEHYQITELHSSVELPQYNIAPGSNIICILSDGKNYRAGDIAWGFQSPFQEDRKLINVRSESAAVKPTFSESFLLRRCVIVADGFYEWSKNKNSKDPMRIQLQDESLFGFAGLWTKFTKQDGKVEYSCGILTTEANELMQDIHERMPVILSEPDAKIWLNPLIQDVGTLNELLHPFESGDMKLYPVSRTVNKPENNSIECIQELKQEKEGLQ